jgi:hypothetical protein
MKRLPKVIAAGLTVFLMAGLAHAADRVYLRSGSDLICDHQKIVNGEIRLYLTPSDDDYLDVAAADIVRREPVPIEPVKANPVERPIVSPVQTAPPTPEQLSALLERAGAEHHLDPDLLASVIHAESGGHYRIVSRTGARGLMQLMPGTAADLGVQDSFAAEQNIAGGTTYLDALLMYYHDNLALALAAYNAGPEAVNRYRGIPPYAETRRYVARVIHDYNRRKLEEARVHRDSLPPASAMAAIVAHP